MVASVPFARLVRLTIRPRIEIKRGKRHPVEVRCSHRLTRCAPIGSQPFLTLLPVRFTKQVQEARPVVHVQRLPRAPRFLKV